MGSLVGLVSDAWHKAWQRLDLWLTNQNRLFVHKAVWRAYRRVMNTPAGKAAKRMDAERRLRDRLENALDHAEEMASLIPHLVEFGVCPPAYMTFAEQEKQDCARSRRLLSRLTTALDEIEAGAAI